MKLRTELMGHPVHTNINRVLIVRLYIRICKFGFRIEVFNQSMVPIFGSVPLP